MFGAGGATGQKIVRAALDRGYEVTGFVRTPGKLTIEDPALRIVQGDATDASAVAEALSDSDCAISAIGGPGIGKSTQITDCTRTIVATASRLHPGMRYLGVSTVGAGDSGSLMPLASRPILLLLRNAIADHNGAEAAVMGSDLRWTIARCVGLTNDPPRGRATASTDRVGGSRIPRADVAAWLVDQVQRPDYERQAVALW